MARVNVNILGISKLKWTELSEFNSDDHYIYTVGRNHLEEMEYPSWSTRVWNAALGCNLKNDRMISVHFQGKPFNITLIQACTPTSNSEETEVEQLYEDLQDIL